MTLDHGVAPGKSFSPVTKHEVCRSRLSSHKWEEKVHYLTNYLSCTIKIVVLLTLLST